MKVLGLDIATKTGWAIYPDRKVELIRVGSFTALGDFHEQKADSFASHLIRLIKTEGKPDMAIIEQPQRNVQQYMKKGTKFMPEAAGDRMTVNAGTALLLSEYTGAAVAILRGFGVPWEVVPVQTWRKSFFPKGTKGVDSADWKKLAKWNCEMHGVDVKNTDEAEAVGVAMYAPATETWRRLRYEKERAE